MPYHHHQPMRGEAELAAEKSVCGLARLPVFTPPAQTVAAMSEPTTTPNPSPENPPPAPPVPPNNPPPAPPAPPISATRIVVEGQKTEREIELEAKLETEAAARRKAETDASYHADEARRLKEIQSNPPPPPAKKTRVRSFMGFTQEVEEGD